MNKITSINVFTDSEILTIVVYRGNHQHSYEHNGSVKTDPKYTKYLKWLTQHCNVTLDVLSYHGNTTVEIKLTPK